MLDGGTNVMLERGTIIMLDMGTNITIFKEKKDKVTMSLLVLLIKAKII